MVDNPFKELKLTPLSTFEDKERYLASAFNSSLSMNEKLSVLLEIVMMYGEKGDKGDKGDKGAKGDKGDTGKQGARGVQGLRGHQGVQGLQGAKGDRGEKGVAGNDGAKGDKGDKGDKGNTGDGLIITGSLDSPVDLPLAGSSGEAYLIDGDLYVWTGSEWNNVGNIKGVKGDKGDQGEQGLQGIQGIQGEKGDQGNQGLQGIQGITGDTGQRGLQGEQGLQGVQGEKGDPFIYTDFTPEQLAGLKGSDGAKGDQGIQGEKGDKFEYSDFTQPQLDLLKGEKGDQGIQGEKGNPFVYTDFTPSQLSNLKGEKGDKGDQGIQGVQGLRGLTGAKGDKGDMPVGAYINGTGGGTLDDSTGTSLKAGGLVTNSNSIMLGVNDKVYVTDLKGYNNGLGMTYKPIQAESFVTKESTEWKHMSFKGGWTNFTPTSLTGHQQGMYRIDHDYNLCLAGFLANGAVGAICTLPAKYRPRAQHTVCAVANSNSSGTEIKLVRLTLRTDGDLYIYETGVSWLSLSNIIIPLDTSIVF